MTSRLFIFILILCILPTTSALGISPAKIEVDFSPNLEWSFNVNVINNEAKYLDVVIFAQGSLSQYTSFSTTSLNMKPDEYSKPVSVSLNLPNKIDKPGVNEVLLTVKEGKSSSGNEPISIGSSITVISLLKVSVPYPGKYAVADLFISSGELGSEITFAVEVNNQGEEDISAAKAVITITDSGGKEVTHIETDEKPIPRRTKRELIAKWTPTDVGNYKALALVRYDGKETSVSKDFNVGNFFLKLLSITVKNFKLGGVAKFDIVTQNIGNAIIPQAYSKMILDEGSRRIMDIESNRIDLKPKETKVMNAYWDTQGVAKGIYYGLVKLIYSDKSSENKIKMTVKDDDIKTEIITGMAVAETPASPKIKTSSVVSAVVIFTLVAASFIFFYIRKRKRGKIIR